MREFLLVAPLARGIESAEHLSEQLAVLGQLVEIAAAGVPPILRTSR
jgi:hypothetical protein